MAEQILIIDDEPNAVENLTHICNRQGYQVSATTDGQEALRLLEQHHFDLVLTDLRIDSVDGMEVLRHAKRINDTTEVILITGYASFDSAVAAMKAGAFHYIAKPFQLNEVREVIHRALSVAALKRENIDLKQRIRQQHSRTRIITENGQLLQLLEVARRVAPTTSSILISGESGTGKELLARYLHEHSNRREQRFQAINCGALQEELLLSELFGHEKGAFTGASHTKAGLFEVASGGTLFLDEIGEMSTSMQIKLLRAIQEREIQRIGGTEPIKVDVRIIAATHRDLLQEVNSGDFRQDLYYRLNVIELQLPPLRARKEDIPLLASHFLHKHGAEGAAAPQVFSAGAVSALSGYHYPGNIRELENIIERAVALSSGEEVTTSSLPPMLHPLSSSASSQPLPPPSVEALPTLAEREEEYIGFVLNHCDGNQTRAAKILGIDRVSLWRRLKSRGDRQR